MRLSLCITYVGAIAILFGRVSSPFSYPTWFINVISVWSHNFRFRFFVLIAWPSWFRNWWLILWIWYDVLMRDMAARWWSNYCLLKLFLLGQNNTKNINSCRSSVRSFYSTSPNPKRSPNAIYYCKPLLLINGNVIVIRESYHMHRNILMEKLCRSGEKSYVAVVLWHSIKR
jgi:hypothetical protein